MTFGSLDRRPIVAEFTGGEINSDAELVLTRQIDQHHASWSQLADRGLLYRPPHPAWVEHSIEAMVAQRLYGLESWLGSVRANSDCG